MIKYFLITLLVLLTLGCPSDELVQERKQFVELNYRATFPEVGAVSIHTIPKLLTNYQVGVRGRINGTEIKVWYLFKDDAKIPYKKELWIGGEEVSTIPDLFNEAEVIRRFQEGGG